MEKIEACGMEVSARELVIALLGKKGTAVLLRFANTAAGHGQLLRALTSGGKRVRVCMEATGMYGLDVALRLSAQEGVELMVANPRACGGTSRGRYDFTSARCNNCARKRGAASRPMRHCSGVIGNCGA
jgi:transposase